MKLILKLSFMVVGYCRNSCVNSVNQRLGVQLAHELSANDLVILTLRELTFRVAIFLSMEDWRELTLSTN